MSENKRFNVPIPKGYQIFFNEMEVSGVGFRRKNATKALSGRSVDLAIEPEPSNKYDSNALKVIAFKKVWFFFQRKLLIGYIPKEIAAEISRKKIANDILPRLKYVWIGDSGVIKIYIDILGKKYLYKGFKED